MTNNPYEQPGSHHPGQPPMGGGPGGPQGPQYGSGPNGSHHNNAGQSPLARVFSNNSSLPKAVRQLQLAAIVSAVAYLIVQIVSLVVSSVALSGLASTYGVEGMAGLGIGVGIFFLVVVMGLYILVIIPLLGGQNWGRILGIVFAILGGLSGLFSLFSVGTSFALSTGLGVVGLLQVVALVGTATWFLIFAFRSDVAAWYTPQLPTGYQPNWGAQGQPGSYNYGGQTPPSGPGQYPGPGTYGGQGGPAGPGQGPGGQGPQQGPPPANPSN